MLLSASSSFTLLSASSSIQSASSYIGDRWRRQQISISAARCERLTLVSSYLGWIESALRVSRKPQSLAVGIKPSPSVVACYSGSLTSASSMFVVPLHRQLLYSLLAILGNGFSFFSGISFDPYFLSRFWASVEESPFLLAESLLSISLIVAFFASCIDKELSFMSISLFDVFSNLNRLDKIVNLYGF